MRTRTWIAIAGAIVLVLVVGVGAAVLVLGGGLGETAAGDVRDGPGGSDATRVAMVDNAFQPPAITVTSGAPVEIELSNTGQVNHNFTSEALKVSTGPMQPGDVKTVTVTLPAGSTQFVCTWHPGMVIDVTGA
jgi:plastocyanin